MICKYCGAKKKFRRRCTNCYDIDFDNVVEIIDKGQQVHKRKEWAGTEKTTYYSGGKKYTDYDNVYKYVYDNSHDFSINYYNGKVDNRCFNIEYINYYTEEIAKLNSFQVNPNLFASVQEYADFIEARKLCEALQKDILFFPEKRAIKALKNAGYSQAAINYAVFTTDCYKFLVFKLISKINILLIPKGKRDFLNEAQTRMNELINNPNLSKKQIRRTLKKEGIPKYYINFVEKYFFV